MKYTTIHKMQSEKKNQWNALPSNRHVDINKVLTHVFLKESHKYIHNVKTSFFSPPPSLSVNVAVTTSLKEAGWSWYIYRLYESLYKESFVYIYVGNIQNVNLKYKGFFFTIYTILWLKISFLIIWWLIFWTIQSP